MVRSIRRLKKFLALSAVLIFFLLLTALFTSNIGIIGSVGEGWVPLTASDLSGIPKSVIDDATQLAQQLFGNYQDKYHEFINQLLAMYLEAKDRDFVVLFNPGGWGWSSVENSLGWRSIFDGIKSELESFGYNALFLNYRRTEASLRGAIDEFVEAVTAYPSKARDLASRVEFLTSHIPDLKVIIAGESNGTVISDGVMDILRDKPRVYSIQTGPPFWSKSTMWERTLVLENNGITPDTFSRGDIPAMLWASFKALLGLAPPDENGRIFYFLCAPGHDYRWQYPDVYHQITDFLKKNFDSKSFPVEGE